MMNKLPTIYGVQRQHRQRGVALVIALIMLILITLLGIASTQTALLGGKTARNERERQIAFTGAQAGIRDAINEIETGTRKTMFGEKGPEDGSTSPHVPGCSTFKDAAGPGLCEPSDMETPPVWLTVSYEADAQRAVRHGWYTGAGFASMEAAPEAPPNAAPQPPNLASGGQLPALHPRYVIEILKDLEQGRDKGGGGGSNNMSFIYRITAVGYGLDQNVQVVLQTIYRKIREQS